MPGELSREEAMRVLDEIADVHPETMLILSGGEPLLRQDLDDLVARSAELGMMPVLGTNGTLLSPERARGLAKRGLAGVGISLDSLLSARHDDFRGKKNAWNEAVEGIRSAREAGLEAQVQITLTRDNWKELPDVIRFSKELGSRAITVFFLVCTGRGQDLVDLSPEEYEEVLGFLAGLKSEGIMVRPRCAPVYRRVLAQRDPDSILLKSDAGRCMAAKNYCRITPEGNVTPCPYMPASGGNLRESSFGEIWNSSKLFQSLRNPELQGRCGSCEYREVCGGCRARAFALKGDPLSEDPWCTYQPGTDGALAAEPQLEIEWTPEAEGRLKKVPFFVRNVVRSAVEGLASRKNVTTVTPELMDEARRTMGRR
jgi:radical SAM protein with 4Fe4S-binding SPASM domain